MTPPHTTLVIDANQGIEVSRAVNSVKNDTPECIEPVKP